MIRQKDMNAIPVIDLTGPEGNAFSLLGNARYLSKRLGMTQEETSRIIEEMMKGDYENLIQTFDSYFGDYVILER